MGKFRLLSKREIDARKAAERRTEIEEGSKLAGRVDHLRETAAIEETKLEAYRVQALTEIQAQIDPKLEEVRKLDSELRGMRAERERLSKPLTEWEADLKKREALAQAAFESIKGEKAGLSMAISANIQRERVNTIEGARVLETRKEATEELVAVQKLHTEAREVLRRAREKDAIIDKALGLREAQVTERESTVAKQAENMREKEKKLIEYENRLFIREQNLKDNERLFRKVQK